MLVIPRCAGLRKLQSESETVGIASQELQEAVLTLYHLATIGFEKGPASKILHSDLDSMFVKNWEMPQQLGLQKVQIPNPRRRR